jgi:hypothetical protein
MSDRETCFVCGRAIDNDEGTGYCSGCATDIGVYAARAGDQAPDHSISLEHLLEELAGIVRRLESVEAKLAETEERLRFLEERETGRAEILPGAPTSEGGPAMAEPVAPTLEHRARALGVDYGRLRKFYSEDELRRLLDDRARGK